MPAQRPSGLTLDTGALIALESGRPLVRDLLAEAERLGLRIRIPAGVLAQAWRGCARQTPIARLLKVDEVEVVPLTHSVALGIGKLCQVSGHADVVDVSVVVCARLYGDSIVTSDPGDLRKIDPGLDLIEV